MVVEFLSAHTPNKSNWARKGLDQIYIVSRKQSPCLYSPTMDKADGVAFRCTLDGADIGRSLEIPDWMFDRCHARHLHAAYGQSIRQPGSAWRVVCVDRQGVEDSDVIIECPALGRIWSFSRPESGRDSWRGRRWRPGSARTEFRGPADGFVRVGQHADWTDLPKDAREVLVGLMMRLILEYAQTAAPTKMEAGRQDRPSPLERKAILYVRQSSAIAGVA
jgi:hypothetical protein